jgi:hypothetical protein
MVRGEDVRMYDLLARTPGTKATLLTPPDKIGIPCRILAVMVGAKLGVSYQVAWWDGRTRNVEWVEEVELGPNAAAKTVRLGWATDG